MIPAERNILLFGLLLLVALGKLLYTRTSSKEWNYQYMAAIFFFLFLVLEQAASYEYFQVDFGLSYY